MSLRGALATWQSLIVRLAKQPEIINTSFVFNGINELPTVGVYAIARNDNVFYWVTLILSPSSTSVTPSVINWSPAFKPEVISVWPP